MDVFVTLEKSEGAGFSGLRRQFRIEPGRETRWSFELLPAAGLSYELLKGSISFQENAPPERELLIAVQGPDPAGFADGRVKKITSQAQVVGVHAPRTVESTRMLMQAREKQRNAKARISLVDGGSSKYKIVFNRLKGDADKLPATIEAYRSAPGRTGPEQQLAEALLDLQRCIVLRSGATIPIVASAEPGESAIHITRAPTKDAFPHPDAYRLHADGGRISVEAATDDGLRNGIYGLLTDHLDCHWFLPKQLGEEAPAANEALSIAAMDETCVPSFFSSAGMSWGSALEWDRRNRSWINHGRMSFGHAWAGFIDPKQYPFEKYPDMWSRDRGGKLQKFDSDWSATNFCSTSPDVIRIVAEKINVHFDANTDPIVASIDPNDLAPLCQCDRCLALDASYGVKPQDDKQMSDRLLHFSKEIHDRLKPQHQQKFLGILAYGYQVRPPKKAVAHPHHATMVCDFPNYFDHTRPFNDPTSPYNRDFASILEGWAKDVKQLGFYDYYGHYNFFGPWGILHKMREDLPAFHEMGGTFLVIESQPNFAMHGLNLYIASRLAWDVNADVDALVEEYVTKFYGPAADAMREFYRGAERHYALTRPGTEAALRVAERESFWTELGKSLAEAERATASLSGAERRYRDRVAFARDGFTIGRRVFDLNRGRLDGEAKKKAKAEFESIKAKYGAADPYWPTAVAPYFIDGFIKTAEVRQ
jgi:hypothetical protein